MFEIEMGERGEVRIRGRLDAAQSPRAQEFLDQVSGECVIDLGALEYVSSAGLGVLLKTQKRMMACGGEIRLINVSAHIADIFRFSGFDRIFKIERAGSAG